MTHGSSTRSDGPEVHADTLGELPAVVQRYLVFHAIITALGFPPEAIGSVLVPVRPDTGSDLAATVNVDGRGFSYVLGPTVPHLTTWLTRAAELWRAAAPAEREALYLSSPLFEHTRFPELLRAITRAGLKPPIPIGLWYSRLESSGIGEAVRRMATFPAAAPSSGDGAQTTVIPTVPPRHVGPPRFALGELAYTSDDSARLPPVELEPLLRRHASGDWGESLYRDDNDAALRNGRAVMSAFRTSQGERLWLITWASRTRTVVWLQTGPDFPEEALLDLACHYLGTGRRTEMHVNTEERLFSLPLVGDFGPTSGDEAETAALLLGAIITQDGENVIAYRPEQFVRALWRAVDGVDLRPIDRKGRRVGHDASDRAFAKAKQRCQDEGIAAWFAATWEDRIA